MIVPSIVVHGGAGDIPDAELLAHQRGCRSAAQAGLDLLLAGATAEDAVEVAVRMMEDDETFDAGRGSFLNRDGIVQLDAAFMEGARLDVGAVAGLVDIANPISLARLVMQSDLVFLAGEGASRFAEARGIARCGQERLVVQREIELYRRFVQEALADTAHKTGDTVGAVAMDACGHLAAGVSTGGTPFKRPGRIGDVPCAGAGFYADDAVGAAVSTGEGEAILRVVMAKRAVDKMASGLSADDAAREVVAYLWQRIGGHAGLIAIDRRGRVGHYNNTARMARAWSEGEEIRTALGSD